ncbi:MAG: HEAT repeat domain-containing protein, partial [Myxococcaceae bacterium]
KVQQEFVEVENQRLFPTLVSAVFQVVEGGLDDAKLLEEMFIQLLDAMLIQEDFATVNQVVLKLRAMEQKDPSNQTIAMLRETFVSKMGEEQRLSTIGGVLKNSRTKHPQDITRYLQVLDGGMVPNLLAVLETVEIPENRQLLSDVLANFAKEFPDPFINRIESDRPQVVRDMVYILEKANHPDKIKIFSKVLLSKNLAVKLEVMNIISRGRTGECRKLIAECLNDPIAQVRMLGARLLCEFDREKAYVDLNRVVKDAAFAKKTPDEKNAFYMAIGATALPGAISMLTGMLAVKPSLFNKQKVLDEKLLAVHGLEGACTIQSFKILQELVEDKSQPTEVLVAARKAMYVTKKALGGEKETTGT